MQSGITETKSGESRFEYATVQETVTLRGIGIHSGSEALLRIHPALPGSGLVFQTGGAQIAVSPFHVTDTRQAVTLGNGEQTVQTVEHLLAALFAAGVTDAILELNGSEVPILDGSAWPFYEAIVAAGVSHSGIAAEPIRLTHPVWVVDGEKYLIALPSDTFEITYSVDYDHPLLRGQTLSIHGKDPKFAEKILPARTFGFLKDLEALQAKGLGKGGSIENAVVLTETGYLTESLRFDNECIRHKVLDLVGDLYLLNRPVQAHIIASRAGHTLDVALTQRIAAGIAGDEITARRMASRFETVDGSRKNR